MKLNFLTFFLILSFVVSQIACSRSETETANSNIAANAAIPTGQKSETAAAPQAKLKTQAEEISQTLANGNYERLADLTHPKVLEMTGGREKMISVSREFMDSSKKQGIEIVSTTVGEPNESVKIGDDLFATVPFAIVLKTPKGSFRQQSTVVGISSDNGANWKFANGINQERFNEMFPAAAGKITIPEQGVPEAVK